MANLGSLLEIEDPWLPPTTWESIPSQNAPTSIPFSHPPQPPRPQPHSPPGTASSVSEASLVRLALNALQGSESALLSIQTLAETFRSHPADRSHRHCWNHRSASTLALGNILVSLASFGSLVLLLRKFVHNFQHFTSLVNQAFAVAVGKVLEGYICSLDTLYTSAAVRRGSPLLSSPASCFTSVVHSQVTLLEVYLHSSELRNQIEALGNICNLYGLASRFFDSSLNDLLAKATSRFSNFYNGGDLLTYLYTQLQVADPAHRALLKYLFIRTCEPYCEFIRSWIFKAEISDPYKEFVVDSIDNSPPHISGKAGHPVDFPLASIRDGVAVPCFLKDFLIPIVRAGQQLQVIKKLLELCNTVGSCDYIYKEFLPSPSGDSDDGLSYAFPMSFGKRNIEAMCTARNNYYIKMQEKLKTLFIRLEFSYQKEVLHDGSVPAIFDIGRKNSDAAVSFILDDRFVVDNTDCDDYGAKDVLYVSDSHESSDCSSLSDLEEQTGGENLSEHPESLVERQQRYLSFLRFSMGSHMDNTPQNPIQIEIPHDIGTAVLEDCGQKDDLMHFSDRKTPMTQMFLPFGLGEPNLSGMENTQDADTPRSKYCPLGLSSSLFYNYKGYNFGQRLDLYNSGIKVSGRDMEFLKGGLPYFSKMNSAKDVSTEKTLGLDRLENESYDCNLFIVQSWKTNYHFNFLSKNPMLRKNACFDLLSEPGKKSSMAYDLSLPCFDFSKVEDPCMLSVDKLAANSCREFESQVPLYATASLNHEKVCGEEDALVDKDRASCIASPLNSNEHGQEAVFSSKVCGGSSWESLLVSFSCNENEGIRDNRECLSDMFEIPLDFVIDKCLLQEISLQYNYVSRLAIKLLEKGFDLKEHLLALRRYYFMESADWADLFIMSLWHHRWSFTDADQRVSEIQGFFELSVQRSSCERDPNKDRLFLYKKGNGKIPLSASAMGVHSFDFLGLGYRVDWPVSLVLTPRALKTYAEIFSFLFQVKLAGFSLTDTWCSLKGLMGLISQKHHSTTIHEREVDQLKLLITMRHQVNHFVCALQQYVQSQLSHVSWCKFLHSLKYKVRDMMDLELVHMAYLSDSMHICFLSDETRAVASIIESILQCAFDFRSCLTGCTWDTGLDDRDFQYKLSRINTSQVFAIKQKFEENLKQLHLCYLKSPKHGEFGLSCFWGYLNYNEYYSDIGTEMGLCGIRR